MLRTLVLLFFLALPSGQSTAGQSPFFWDSFERTEELVFTGERESIGWHLGTSENERVAIEAGQLFLTPISNEVASVFYGIDEPIDAFAIFATVRFPDASAGGNPFLMNIYWDSETNAFAWGGVDASGRGRVGSGGRSDTFPDQISAAAVEDNDVHIRLEKADSLLRVKVWPESEAESDATWMEMTSPAEQAKAIGIAINPGAAIPQRAVVALSDFALLPLLTGDYNANGTLDAEDIDLISNVVQRGDTNRAFDITNDGRVTNDDRDTIVHDLLATWYGDANLDGEFNSLDFVSVFQIGEYEDGIDENSVWSTGDWDGNRDFDSGDFVFAFQDGGYEAGPKPAIVPEPTGSCVWLCLVLAKSTVTRTSRRRRPTLPRRWL